MAEDRLPSGHAMPYIAIFDQKGDPIMDPFTELPLGMYVTEFTYKFDEEDDDELNIVIETGNPDIASLPAFKNRFPLIVQWGYIYPNGGKKVSQPRTVIVRDDTLDINESGIKVTLKCTDSFSLLKSQPADRSNELFINWVKFNLRGLDLVRLIDYRVTEKVVVKGNNFTKKEDE
jgi:hypothetical protein